MISERIFAHDSKGVLRFWQYEVEGSTWRGISGQVGGAETASGWTHCVPKSKDTAEEQAIFEAAAEEKKKLDRKYRRTVAELEAGGIFTQPMLAREYDKLKKPLTFPVFAQPKLDGIRSLTAETGANSRQGQPINSVSHILEELEPVFAEFPDLEIDGELYNHEFKDDFNTLTSVIRKGFKVDKKRLKAGVSEEEQRAELLAIQQSLIQYHVYDIVDTGLSTEHRNDFLVDLFDRFHCPSVRVVPTWIIHSQEELDRLLENWLLEGYEGQMVRIIDAPYEHTRSAALLKRKDFFTQEFKLLRIEEGNGNWKGYAKRVVFALEDGRENEAGIRGNMEKAKELLENKEYYEQGWVTIRAMKQRTPDGKLRAPVAIDFHPEGRKD